MYKQSEQVSTGTLNSRVIRDADAAHPPTATGNRNPRTGSTTPRSR